MELIFAESIRINGDDAKEDKIKVDTTVQEKNITYPTDANETMSRIHNSKTNA